jgi:hypothetical protein
MKRREIAMMSRCVLGSLIGLSILFASLSGCSKKEDAPPVEAETAPETRVTTVEAELPEEPVSAAMAEFLGKSVGRRKVSAGEPIHEYFAFWETLLHRPEVGMEIYLKIEVEKEFQADRVWENKTNREFLDSLCQENGLVWTIAGPDTIRISAKAK